jgi:hypothetical protein
VEEGKAFLRSLIISDSSSEVQTVSSDQDFRASKLLSYLQQNGQVKNLQYELSTDDTSRPTWYLVHSVDVFAAPRSTITHHSEQYQLEKTFQHTAESGWTWWLYRKANRN